MSNILYSIKRKIDNAKVEDISLENRCYAIISILLDRHNGISKIDDLAWDAVKPYRYYNISVFNTFNFWLHDEAERNIYHMINIFPERYGKITISSHDFIYDKSKFTP